MCALGTTCLLLVQLPAICYGIGFLAPIGVGVSSIVYGSICYFKECCSESAIKPDFKGLQQDLDKYLYGQHLARDIVLHALKAHWKHIDNPQKALTLSFHGWPGSGKNYVSDFIIKNIYKYGSKSKFVHHFIGRLHFPSEDKVTKYQQDLYSWIKGNVSACPKQIFVFDEVDKMPPGVLNIIKPMIDYRDDVDGLDYRQSIFIFLSNTGSHLINNQYLELWHTKGISRNNLKLSDFESLITKGSFNEEGISLATRLMHYLCIPFEMICTFVSAIGGFHHSDTIRSNLIDHYVPFLPMDMQNVRLCVLREFERNNVTKPEERYIKEAMEVIEWGPSNEQIFSTTGCKRLSKQVGMIVYKYNLY